MIFENEFVVQKRFIRGNQTMTIPLHFSRDLIPSSVFYASVIPVLGYLLLDRLIIKPFVRSEEER